MGHLVNPISRQIKYYASWKITSSQFLRKDFSYFFFIDQYIKSVITSITYLKSFFNKFFFYDINYFIKNNTLLFFFSFKIIRKTSFKFYWKYRYPFYLSSNYPDFKKKSRAQRNFHKNFLKIKSVGSFPAKKEIFMHKTHSRKYAFNIQFISMKRNKLVPYDLLLRKKVIFFKIKSFKLNFFKYKLFNKYLLNNLYLKKFNLKLLILKNITFLRNSKSYGTSLFLLYNSLHEFNSSKLLSNPIFLTESLKRGLMLLYINENLFKNDFFDMKKRSILLFNKIIFFAKHKSLRFLKKYYLLAFKKFKLRPKLKRRFLSVRVKGQVRYLRNRIKKFTRRLIFFVKQMQGFLKSNVAKVSVNSFNLELIASLLHLKFDSKTKNYAFLRWLRVLITHIN